MLKKRCLFCNELVPVETDGQYETVFQCMCAPEGRYRMPAGDGERIQSMEYGRKHKLFPLVSGYIRQRAERDRQGQVTLTFDEVLGVEDSTEVPVSIEQKANRLMAYLYSRSERPGQSVNLHPLSRHSNLTFSPTLQELVFIIEQLREGERITREGSVLRLTERGWRECAEREAKRGGKPCVVLVEEPAAREHASEEIVTVLRQYGYEPEVISPSFDELAQDAAWFERLSACKLAVAELANAGPALYWAAGCAEALKIPVIWTLWDGADEAEFEPNMALKPLIWRTKEEIRQGLAKRFAAYAAGAAGREA